ncbi:hemolysin family protein [Lachnospiraceae bacterium JLR.KK008]
MDTDSWIGFLILALLLTLSAFFSSAETALTTVNKIRIRTLIEEENRRAVTVQKILDNYSKMLSTILVGNNIVNISASSLATTLAIRIWGSYAVGIMTGALTLFVLLFGEIMPKTWAMYNSEKISLAYAGIIYSLMVLFTPIIFVVDRLSGAIMLLFHINTAKTQSAMTERDLKTYVDVSHEDGAIETEEREMIYNVFDFSDSSAKDIMIPRIDITMVDITASYNHLLAVFRESMYTRIPVYENDTDNVVGIVNIKDFLFVPNKRAFRIQDILREAYYTYEYKKTADLMMEMREATMNVAFVLNEYGACVGMITLEDLLEEIVGEIRDEYDEDEQELIKEVGERQYLVAGNVKLDDINDALDIQLISEDYDSIAGILIGTLDRLPQTGETVTIGNGMTIRAEEINQNRIEKVLLTLPEPEEMTPQTEENDEMDIPTEEI